MLMPGTTTSGMRNTGRSCRALSAKGSSLLLACCWLARRTTATHPFRSTTPLCPRATHLHRSSSNIPRELVLVASTRRLSTQRAGTRGFYFASATPCLHATPRPLTRARKHAPTYLSIARSLHTHTTTSPPPPLSSILHLQLCSSSPPPPHTNTTPSCPTCPPSYHDFFGNQSPPVHVPVKTDRHSIQPAL